VFNSFALTQLATHIMSYRVGRPPSPGFPSSPTILIAAHCMSVIKTKTDPDFWQCQVNLLHLMMRNEIKRGPKGSWVAHLRNRSKVTVEPFTNI